MRLLPSVRGSGDSAARTSPSGRGTPSPSRARSSSPQSPGRYQGACLQPREPRPALAAFGLGRYPGPQATSPRPPSPCADPRASVAALGLKEEDGRPAQGRVRGKRDHTHFKIHLLQFFKSSVRPVPEPRGLGTEVTSSASLGQTPRSSTEAVSEALYA